MNDQQKAIKELQEQNAACAVVKQGIVVVSQERGIKPLMLWLQKDPNFFAGACVADKVVGKAAALLFIYGKVQQVHAQVISEHAAKVLEQFHIPYTYSQRVPFIINRAGTGMCPMENKVLPLSDPAQAYKALSFVLETRPEENR